MIIIARGKSLQFRKLQNKFFFNLVSESEKYANRNVDLKRIIFITLNDVLY